MMAEGALQSPQALNRLSKVLNAGMPKVSEMTTGIENLVNFCLQTTLTVRD